MWHEPRTSVRGFFVTLTNKLLDTPEKNGPPQP